MSIFPRYARQERYAEPAALYKKLYASPRATRMQELVRLYAAANSAHLSSDARLEAQYIYAAFLEAHSTQVFLNDMLWGRMQDWIEGSQGPRSRPQRGRGDPGEHPQDVVRQCL